MVIFEATDLNVILVSSTGTLTPLSLGSGSTNYSVNVATYPGTGSITYPATGGTPLPTGSSLLVQRLAPLSQPLSLVNAGPYLPQNLMAQLDYLTALCQQLQLQISRCITTQVNDPAPTIPLPQASARANQYMVFDGSGNPTTGLPVGSATVSSAMLGVVNGATAQIALSLQGGAPTLATKAALAAVTTAALPNGLCSISGFTVAADGGEGVFVVGTTTTADGGTIINDASGRSWYRLTGGGPFNVRWFGAKGDGVTDDTTAIQAAITAAQTACRALYFPGTSHFYLVSSALNVTAPLRLFGDYGTSTINTSAVSADLLVINAANVEVHGISFGSTVTKAAGNYINVIGGSNIRIHHFVTQNAYCSINLAATFASIIDITDGYFFNTLANCFGMTISGGFEIRLRHLIMNSGASPQPTAGILVANSGDIIMEDVNIVQHGRDLLLTPGAGQSIDSVYATDCFFDTSSAQGLLIQPASTGVLARSRFIGCWFSSHTGSGVSVQGSTGSVTGLEFIDCHAFGNTDCGFDFEFGSGYTLIGCQAAGNTNAGAKFGAGISNFTVTGCTLGPSGGFGSNNYGVFLTTGGSDHYIVVNNHLEGNVTSAFANGGTGTHTIVSPNLTV